MYQHRFVDEETAQLTAMSAGFSGGDTEHCVFMFRMAVDPPQGDHKTKSGSAERENGPAPTPARVMSYLASLEPPVKSIVLEQ
jgi:hypothetical protein